MNKNVLLAVVIATGLLLWLLSGQWVTATDNQNPKSAQVPLTVIESAIFVSREFVPQLSLRAYTEQSRAVDIKAQISGAVVALPVLEGAEVAARERICVLDKEDRPQQLRQAEAEVARADIEYQGALRLKQGGFQSEIVIAQAKARLQAAEAQLARRQLDLNNLDVRAPFDGVLEQRHVELGDFVQHGQPCATLLDLNPLKVITFANEQEVGQLLPGNQAQIELVTGESLHGIVSYIGRRTEGSTKSYRVEIDVDNPGNRLRAGLSARVDYQLPPRAAHLLPAHLLVLDERGDLVVKMVLPNQRVQSVPVNIFAEGVTGTWVGGLPEQVELVVVGQNYVSDGQQIDVKRKSL